MQYPAQYGPEGTKPELDEAAERNTQAGDAATPWREL